MNKIYCFSLFFFINLLLFTAHFDLTKPEMQIILSGKIIVKTKKIKDAPWPEIIIFSIINASPLESISIFTAY